MKNREGKTTDLFDNDVLDDIRMDISKHEGVVFGIYLDHLGNKTMGIGHLITREDPEFDLPEGYMVSEDRVMDLFEEDFEQAVTDANRAVPLLYARPVPVQRVMVNMAFQLGYPRLKTFKRTLAYVHQCQYNEAADEMMDSLWARQTPKRAQYLSELMRSAYTPPRKESEENG